MLTLMIGGIVGVGTLLFIIRRVKIALGIPVLGDGHLIREWKAEAAERRKRWKARIAERRANRPKWRWRRK